MERKTVRNRDVGTQTVWEREVRSHMRKRDEEGTKEGEGGKIEREREREIW